LKREHQYRNSLVSLVGQSIGEKRFSPKHLSFEKRGVNHQAELLGLPEIVVNPAEDLDTQSPTFGQFFYMVDYDPLD
jgi:hypothetical protein